MANWSYAGASVVGHSHLATNVPCQDKHKTSTSNNGDWIAISVSDGAGSAEHAETGAEITSEYFCNELIKLSKELESRTPGEWINDFVVECVLNVRKELRKIANGEDLRKYHCTLVAALMGPSGGFAIHIGDGAIFGGAFAAPDFAGFVELNTNYVISKPENGEYSNETYFITESHWIKHLRITPLPKLDWIVACTDGGASLLLEGETEAKPTFLCPFLERQVTEKGNQYIAEVISDPKANKLTTDDKTIVVAIRNGILSGGDKFSFTKDFVGVENKTTKSVSIKSAETVEKVVSSQPSNNVKSDVSKLVEQKAAPKNRKPVSKFSWKRVLKATIIGFFGVAILIACYFLYEKRPAWIFPSETPVVSASGTLQIAADKSPDVAATASSETKESPAQAQPEQKEKLDK